MTDLSAAVSKRSCSGEFTAKSNISTFKGGQHKARETERERGRERERERERERDI